MNVTYLDETGKPQIPTMGCYGIGVDRALASIIEEHHDDEGITWPMSVAPYQVVVVPVKYENEMKSVADKIYNDLLAAGIEVILDDRNERPGVKFKDSELIGIPVRIVVCDKNLPNVEYKNRTEEKEILSVEDSIKKAIDTVKKQLAELNA